MTATVLDFLAATLTPAASSTCLPSFHLGNGPLDTEMWHSKSTFQRTLALNIPRLFCTLYSRRCHRKTYNTMDRLNERHKDAGPREECLSCQDSHFTDKMTGQREYGVYLVYTGPTQRLEPGPPNSQSMGPSNLPSVYWEHWEVGLLLHYRIPAQSWEGGALCQKVQ